MSFPITGTVGVKSYQSGARDDFGNPVESWSDPVDIPVHGWGPRSDDSAEPSKANRDLIVEGLSVLAPAGTVVGARDHVIVAGVEYEVEGEIRDWSHGPFPFPGAGVTIILKNLEG